LEELLTVNITGLKITKNMVEQSLDIFTNLYIEYNHTDHTNRGTFINFFNKTVWKVRNEYNSICSTLLKKVDENNVKGIIESYIGYIQESLKTEPVANQATGENKSLFDFLTSGSPTRTRDEREIKFYIVEDDITFVNINIVYEIYNNSKNT
jgi:hypothetical protein